MLPSISALTLKSDSLSVPCLSRMTRSRVIEGVGAALLLLLLLMLRKTNPFPSLWAQEGWSNHNVQTRIPCVFSSFSKSLFLFGLVSSSAQAKQKEGKPTTGWFFKPSLLLHLFIFLKTDMDVLYHFPLRQEVLGPKIDIRRAGHQRRWAKRSTTRQQQEKENTRLWRPRPVWNTAGLFCYRFIQRWINLKTDRCWNILMQLDFCVEFKRTWWGIGHIGGSSVIRGRKATTICPKGTNSRMWRW